MTNWQEEFDKEFGEYRLGNHHMLREAEPEDIESIKAFISTQLEALIDDIGNDDWAMKIPSANIIPLTEIKQHLKDKWLRSANEESQP